MTREDKAQTTLTRALGSLARVPVAEAVNPGRYVAIAHYDEKHSRLLCRDEVLRLLSNTSPREHEHERSSGSDGSGAAFDFPGSTPVALQKYIPPVSNNINHRPPPRRSIDTAHCSYVYNTCCVFVFVFV